MWLCSVESKVKRHWACPVLVLLARPFTFFFFGVGGRKESGATSIMRPVPVFWFILQYNDDVDCRVMQKKSCCTSCATLMQYHLGYELGLKLNFDQSHSLHLRITMETLELESWRNEGSESGKVGQLEGCRVENLENRRVGE